MHTIGSTRLRRIALTRQGLASARPFGTGLNATLAAIRRLNYVQIDTISVVARAHDHVLRSRVPDFSASHLNKLLERREIFEYRFPVAAFRPMEDYRFTLLHAAKFREKPRMDDKGLMRRVLRRIQHEGPLRARDFESAEKRGSGWWDWKPAKSALEQLYYQGDLMISGRDGFEKSYDLAERVLPSQVDSTKPSLDEFASFLVDSTIEAHGFGSYATFAARSRHVAIGRSLRVALQQRVSDGRLRQYASSQGVLIWATPAMIEGKLPRMDKRVRILSPFDGVVIQRERLREVFGFDYLIECYVPEQKRKFGYYCLPLLYGDRFIGRMDCKSHREEGQFEIKAMFLEPDFAAKSIVENLSRPFADAVMDYARFQGCTGISIAKTRPRSAQSILQEAFIGLSE